MTQHISDTHTKKNDEKKLSSLSMKFAVLLIENVIKRQSLNCLEMPLRVVTCFFFFCLFSHLRDSILPFRAKDLSRSPDLFAILEFNSRINYHEISKFYAP